MRFSLTKPKIVPATKLSGFGEKGDRLSKLQLTQNDCFVNGQRDIFDLLAEQNSHAEMKAD